jgi:AcrR family transcriptional regulator
VSATRPARRLSSEARRDQLADIAQELIARDGHAGFSLDEVAERADVTRNLLYHYFPRGRLDLFLAAVERGGEEITGGWVTDESVPLAERMAANFGRLAEHARRTSPAWLVYRQARASAEPEVLEALAVYHDRIVASISTNHLGTPDPPPLVRLALNSYVAFAEVALDEARTSGQAEDDVNLLLARVLAATISAAADS